MLAGDDNPANLVDKDDGRAGFGGNLCMFFSRHAVSATTEVGK